jgi:hypothetical protein
VSPPDPAFEALLATAFHRARAADANAELDAIRSHGREEGGVELLSYEILVPASDPMRHLVEAVLPKLVYFLDCRGAKLPRAAGVFVSLFFGDALYCLEAADLIEALVKHTGLAPDEMVKRWGAASV